MVSLFNFVYIFFLFLVFISYLMKPNSLFAQKINFDALDGSTYNKIKSVPINYIHRVLIKTNKRMPITHCRFRHVGYRLAAPSLSLSVFLSLSVSLWNSGNLALSLILPVIKSRTTIRGGHLAYTV